MSTGIDWVLIVLWSSWENLGAMLLVKEEPWVCLGDFNLVIDDQEKDRGRRARTSTPNFHKDV